MSQQIFLSWDTDDPKAIYTRQLKGRPVYWNDDAETWVAHAYNDCKAILSCEHTCIPKVHDDGLLNDKARLLIKKLARLANGDQHLRSRQAAMGIYDHIQQVSVRHILSGLLSDVKDVSAFDWIAAVCKKLPVMVILNGLGFSGDDCEFVTAHISSLVKILSPDKTASDIEAINKAVDEFYHLSEKYVVSSQIFSQTGEANSGEMVELLVCNLIGLFIQCYDAGRGVLANSLLNMIRYDSEQGLRDRDISFFERLVTETLRFDPPVHSTRRVAAKDIHLDDHLIKEGQKILIVVAAANLDPQIFKDPGVFDPLRNNNNAHLTFGAGGHMCLAKYLTLNMTAQVCSFLASNYNKINIIQQEFKYEPQTNVRLIKELMIGLT